MKDIKQVTIDSIMRDYYNSICATELLEDNIEIDDTIVDEESSVKYLQLFAAFLNEAYYRGYIISDSIMKKLMDVMEYTGYEYQVMDVYANKLLNAMRDKIYDEVNHPEYRSIILEPSESKDFIVQYMNTCKDLEGEITSDKIPHFRNPESKEEDKLFKLNVLQEENYPIDRIFHDLKNSGNINFNMISEYSYILWKNNRKAYEYIVQNVNDITLYTFFLLDETDNEALDILVDSVNTLRKLARLITRYKDFNNDSIIFNDTVNNNIRRLIEIITINTTIEQTAMLIGPDYDLWRKYCDNNYHKINTLLFAVNLYQSDASRFNSVDLLKPDYIFKLRNCYNFDSYNDIAFYARYGLMNMDIKQFCFKFIEIYTELQDQINKSELLAIVKECIIRFISLRNTRVDRCLIDLHNHLQNIIYGKRNNIIIKFDRSQNTLVTELPECNIDEEILEEIASYIKHWLYNRNGESYEHGPYNENKPQYNIIARGESLEGVKYFYDGFTLNDVRIVEILNPDVKTEDVFLSDKFTVCLPEEATYIAKYVDIPENAVGNSLNILLIVGDSNVKLRYTTDLYPGKYLFGLHTANNGRFICHYPLSDDDTVSLVSRLDSYFKQQENCLDITDLLIIEYLENEDSYCTDITKYADEVTNIIEVNEELSEYKYSNKEIYSLF